MQPTQDTTKPTPCTLCGSLKAQPYGPNRSFICKPCASADPERKAIANMYYREAADKAVQEAADALRRIFPNLVVIDASAMLADDPEPCPICSYGRKADA